MASARVLVVTGDYAYKEDIQREALLKRDLIMDYAKTMDEAMSMLVDNDYVLVMIRADAVENLSLLKVMRSLIHIPILMFSYTEPDDKVEGLRMGAHVYIATPYSRDYIIESAYSLAQLFTSATGRYEAKQPEFLTYEYVRVCIDSRQVFVKGKLVAMTRKEFNTLCVLMRNKGMVLTYAEIFRQAWGEEYVDSSVNALSTTIKRLKQKMSIEPRTKNYIKNIHQVGYSFDPS